MKTIFISLVAGLAFCGCDSFTEVDLPDSQLTSEIVFADVRTADAALSNIYAQLRDATVLTGLPTGISNTLGVYSDEMTYFGSAGQPTETFYLNNLLETSVAVKTLWNNAYNLIYQANAVYKGVTDSQGISEGDKSRLIGEALYLRAFLHFHLTNLFGEIPYITTTDYRVNSTIGKISESQIYNLLSQDLLLSEQLLPESYLSIDRNRPNKSVATALRARAGLYSGDWQQAHDASSLIINSTSIYNLVEISEVFLRESEGTIWQLTPQNEGENTFEAQTFIFESGPPPSVALSSELISAFEPNDQRYVNWIGNVTDGQEIWYYPFKYKESSPTATTLECSIIIRIEEMYLIRAEASARLGDINSAKQDLDIIRERAGLQPTAANNQTDLVSAILNERRVELFAEHGHRWFDLKRTGLANTTLQTLKPGWNSTDILWPIPEAELLLNPALMPQNPGY
jgi:hypothetical protein